jgi:two-component system CitB family sensor kinase
VVAVSHPSPHDEDAGRRRHRLSFSRQLLLLEVALLVVVLGLGFGLVAWLTRATLVHQYEQRALGVARSVAAQDGLGDDVAVDRQPEVQRIALRAQHATHALFVVVTNARGVRLAHPDPDRIGEIVSTSPSLALHGHEEADVERGTLGLSARGKVPLRDSTGVIVGEVSVGFDASEISSTLRSLLVKAAVFMGAALMVGIGGATMLSRLLKRRTLGFEPHDLAGLVREREAVLFGVSDGVIGIDPQGRVTSVNNEARRLLGVDLAAGDLLDRIDIPAPVRRALAQRRDTPVLARSGERVLVVRHRPVVHGDVPLGAVLTMYDRTEVETLTNELHAVLLMTQALRVQRHEFANRLHTVHGLLQTACPEDAASYVAALLDAPQLRVGEDDAVIESSVLRGFLAAKVAEAARAQVTLALSDGSWVPHELVAPVEVVTVLGNLVNNAVEAAAESSVRPARVEVDLLADGLDLVIAVANTSDGIPDDLRDALFGASVTSHGAGRGLGLSIAADVVERIGGRLALTHPGGDGAMTVVTGRLDGVLVDATSRSAAEAPTAEAPTAEAVHEAAFATGSGRS